MKNSATLQLEELSCPSCLIKIERALSKLDGVSQVQVLFNASRIKVGYLPDIITITQIVDRMTALGYTVKSVKIKELVK
ncbi:heavy-metal-associated domain-containing protein [Weissella diestrammenae]|uniref:Heavy-metal-associated domain-containing protein n=1 Tax=Weissella diestrammenae TaxID=1162633 RepID=A0A7G9T5K2_9LACO|nr:heavy-metal-associated domain-containing protein [Weissella diestrammenae]MCM0582204.1 heavy-metal-associated domain-containing protein [Weissella diestrammenae]QNN75377.1 heavy-metal-associated domain-containing protein [Weissella diestrammenae]